MLIKYCILLFSGWVLVALACSVGVLQSADGEETERTSVYVQQGGVTKHKAYCHCGSIAPDLVSLSRVGYIHIRWSLSAAEDKLAWKKIVEQAKTHPRL